MRGGAVCGELLPGFDRSLHDAGKRGGLADDWVDRRNERQNPAGAAERSRRLRRELSFAGEYGEFWEWNNHVVVGGKYEYYVFDFLYRLHNGDRHVCVAACGKAGAVKAGISAVRVTIRQSQGENSYGWRELRSSTILHHTRL